MDSLNGRSFNRRSLLSHIRGNKVLRASPTTLVVCCHRATPTERSHPPVPENKRAAHGCCSSPFFHALLKRPDCLSFSRYHAEFLLLFLPPIRLPLIISENRVHRPSSKQFPTNIDSLAYTTASPFESLVSSFASTSSPSWSLHRDRPPLRLR